MSETTRPASGADKQKCVHESLAKKQTSEIRVRPWLGPNVYVANVPPLWNVCLLPELGGWLSG